MNGVVEQLQQWLREGEVLLGRLGHLQAELESVKTESVLLRGRLAETERTQLVREAESERLRQELQAVQTENDRLRQEHDGLDTMTRSMNDTIRLMNDMIHRLRGDRRTS